MTDDVALHGLERLIANGVPAGALMFYGRWFQLETWLREIIYVELRAKYGSGWTAHLTGQAPSRAAKDQRNAYMASADAGDLLTYADVADLFGLIDDQWTLFADYLLPEARWRGRTDELRELRNRNAHCRRPHQDDVRRVEQTLRDLESGAAEFYASYASPHGVSAESSDPLAKAWAAGEHDDARRLLNHAQSQYDVQFALTFTVRPWGQTPDADHISGSEGVLWQARWIIAGGRDVRPTQLWRDLERRRSTPGLLVHLLLDSSSVTATFSALDPPDQIADAIGHVFDSILVTSRFGRPDFDPGAIDSEIRAFRAEVERLPALVQTDSALCLIDPYEPHAFSIFAATT